MLRDTADNAVCCAILPTTQYAARYCQVRSPAVIGAGQSPGISGPGRRMLRDPAIIWAGNCPYMVC